MISSEIPTCCDSCRQEYRNKRLTELGDYFRKGESPLIEKPIEIFGKYGILVHNRLHR